MSSITSTDSTYNLARNLFFGQLGTNLIEAVVLAVGYEAYDLAPYVSFSFAPAVVLVTMWYFF